MLETIDLDVDEANELLFRVKIEGSDPAPARVRLVCESGDVAFMFNGRLTGEPDVVQFNVPVMKDKLKEGLYVSRVEVLVENRYFAPVQFQVNFKKTVRVVAEAVTLAAKKQPEVRVTAAPIVKPKATAQAPKPAEKPAEQAKKTLHERYKQKQEPEELNEESLRQLARSFARARSKK